MPNAITVTTKGRAVKRGRYVMAPDSLIRVGRADAPELVGVGAIPGKDDDDSALVYEFGAQQIAFPFYAANAAYASGITVPFDALLDAFDEAGTLPALKRAILKRLPDPKPPAAPKAS